MMFKQLFVSSLIIGFAFSFPCETGSGTNCFYVRANLVSGSHNGSDWNNAANALPSVLQRGYKYYFSKGTYGALTLDDAQSQQQYIYIYSATDANHGANTGWSSNLVGQVVFDGVAISTGYYIIDGQTGGGPGSWSQGFGIKVTGTFTQNYGTLVTFFNSPANITITHTEIAPNSTNYYVSAVYNGGTNGVISYCYIHDLYGTPFHIFGQWNNLLIEYSYIARSQSTPAEHAEGMSDGGSDNIVIRNNIWEDIAGTATIALINGPGVAQNWEIYGNVIVHTEKPCSNAYGTCHLTTYDAADIISVIQDGTNDVTATNWKIYNNAFVNYRGRGSLSISGGSSNVQIYNNIWWCNFTGSYENYVFISGPVTYSHNFYSKCVFPYSFTMGTAEPPKMDTAYYQDDRGHRSVCGLEIELTGAIAGYPGLALNTLVNGSNWVRTDPLGQIRGGDGVWDRGAYEFNSGVSVTSGVIGNPTSGVAGSGVSTSGSQSTTSIEANENGGTGIVLNALAAIAFSLL